MEMKKSIKYYYLSILFLSLYGIIFFTPALLNFLYGYTNELLILLLLISFPILMICMIFSIAKALEYRNMGC